VVGNNAFSYDKRETKRIYVAPLIEDDISGLSVGDEIVFSEIDNKEEKNRTGLKNFIYFKKNEKHVFIFDNHNHAFFFWIFGFLTDLIKKGMPLVHVDQHSDMRKPNVYFPGKLNKELSLKSIFEYTNFAINVGNFIQPALKMGLFSQVDIIDSSWSFNADIPENFVLDIDMDIFSDDMNYIKEDKKIEKIKSYIDSSRFITVATSPYFIDQKKSVYFVKKLFN